MEKDTGVLLLDLLGVLLLLDRFGVVLGESLLSLSLRRRISLALSSACRIASFSAASLASASNLIRMIVMLSFTELIMRKNAIIFSFFYCSNEEN